MIADIWTIAWKEWKEVLLQRGGGLRRGWVNLAVIVAVFGVFLPLQVGRAWVSSPMVLAAWAWVPMILVTNVVADSFAGERERHTLETLLASRMPDRPILLGKLLAALAYGWGTALVNLVLGLITVNIAHGRGELLLYPAATAAGGVLLSLLMAGLAAGAGILVSLRAPTVRQAQQTLGIATMLLVWIPILGINLLPKDAVASAMQASVNPVHVLGTALVILAIADAVLIAIAMARFQRSRLILD